jgi:transcriptional regulator with XRE-family HTH domain
MKKTIYEDDYSHITRRLVAMRQAAGLTQRQLAQRLKWPQSVVARIEVSERRLDVLEFIAWCEVLKADPGKILAEVHKEVLKHR